MTDAPDPLEQALREAIHELDAVPPAVVDAARAAFTWRTVDAELAALAFDSAGHDALAGVRGAGGPRALSFEVGDVVIEVEVREQPGQARDLLGQVAAPGAPAPALELQVPGGPRPVTVDDLGRFTVTGVPAGPVRLRCTFPGGRAPVATEWVLI